ncbi:MAG: hypothetical protein ABF254_05705 [Octadecabacter sp.]
MKNIITAAIIAISPAISSADTEDPGVSQQNTCLDLGRATEIAQTYNANATYRTLALFKAKDAIMADTRYLPENQIAFIVESTFNHIDRSVPPQDFALSTLIECMDR